MQSIPDHLTEGKIHHGPKPKSFASRPNQKDRAFWNNVCAILRESRPAVARLRNLQSIDLRSSPAFNQAMHRHIVQYAASEAVITKRQNLLLPLLFAFSALPILFFEVFSFDYSIFPIQYTLSEWINITFSMVVSYIIFSVLFYQLLRRNRTFNSFKFQIFEIPDTPWHRIRRERDRKGQESQSSPVNLFAYWYAFAILYRIVFFKVVNYFFLPPADFLGFTVRPNTIPPPFFAGLWFWLAITALLFVVSFIPTYLPRRQLNGGHPQTVICIRLLEALSLLEQYPDSWRVASFKKEIVHKLEEAALRMEFNVPHQLRSRDLVTDAWLTQSFTGIARSIREQKKLILLQELGARQALIDFLTRELPHAANGDLGNMARVEEPTPADQRKGMIRQLLGLLAAIIKGGLPLLVILLIQQSSYAVSSNLINPLLIGSLLYLVVSILREIDPFYTDKIGAVKDLFGFSPKT